MSLMVEYKKKWLYIPAPGRWDAFNYDQSRQQLLDLSRQFQFIAIDVAELQFISIQMLKLIHEVAEGLANRGGRFALIGSTEKLKRQFHIFASLRPFTLFTPMQWLVETEKQEFKEQRSFNTRNYEQSL